MTLGLIGCGKMGSALLKGILQAGLVYPEQVSVYDSHAPSMKDLAVSQRVTSAADISEVVGGAELIFICVKPADVSAVLEAAAECGQRAEAKLFVSIAAGMTIARMQALLPEKARVIRVMPNTPALVGKGASAFALGSQATEEDGAQVRELLEGVGIALQVEEKQLDAVTGLSGSGPAYIYSVIEALAEGGVKEGLSAEVALQLAAQTVAGAAVMVQETGLSPQELREQVTSPNGTTLAGLQKLAEVDLKGDLISAVHAATKRSKELAAES